MKLSRLLDGIEYEIGQGSIDAEISDIINDSRNDVTGAAFVCQEGTNFDSHTIAEKVAADGAAALIASKKINAPESVTIIYVKDTRKTYALMCAAFFGHPTREMTVIGVTGTKGKTTSTHMIKAIIEAAGHKAGLCGTNGIMIGDEHVPTVNTTPDPHILQSAFRKMVDEGCEYMIMEVSSQGLMMDRVAGIDFDLGVFTNLSPDHIGPTEHANFEEYAAAKSLLFQRCRTGTANIDDENFDLVTAGHTCELHTFGTAPAAEYRATGVNSVHRGKFMGMVFDYHGSTDTKIELGIPAIFNVYNALAAISAAELLGMPMEAIKKALYDIKVNGRMELVYSSEKCTVIVDYAHNGISAESLLRTLRSYEPKRLVVVFGCGGNRDPHRRYEMGEAAGKYADFAIITSDNSRYESPLDIIKDIHIGFDPTGSDSVDIPNRRDAIEYSIEHSQPGDVVAIIGKGHEDYQEENGKRVHFLDREEAEAVIKRLGWT